MKLKKEEIDKLFKEGAELQKTFGIKSNWHNIGNHSITKTQYDACLRRFKEEAKLNIISTGLTQHIYTYKNIFLDVGNATPTLYSSIVKSC